METEEANDDSAATDKSNENKIKRLERENRSLNQYNNELREQVNLLNAKLYSINKHLVKTVEVQTDLQIDCLLSLGPAKDGLDIEDKQKQNKLDLDNFLNNLKSEAMQGYVYDANSKTYYSPSTGWYYYPENCAYYNPSDQNYYTYDAEANKFTLLCSIQQTKESEEGETKDENNDLEIESDVQEEEGEIVDVSDDDNLDDQKAECKSHGKSSARRWQKKLMRANSKLSNVSPIRLIVLKSTSLELGSLLLVSCLGGKIGQASHCEVSIPDVAISQTHAEISYDRRREVYYLQDLSSRNGTFVNNEPLRSKAKFQLLHGDVVRFAETELLAHIHPNRDVTCDECEPGTAMAKLSLKTGSSTSIYKTDEVALSARERMKKLKKKYGLNGDGFRDVKLPSGYQDRAVKRQKEVGSDNPYEKTAAGSALDMPLDQRNVGFQIMERMGWKSGEGVGADGQGDTQPIDFELRENRTGLGFGSRK